MYFLPKLHKKKWIWLCIGLLFIYSQLAYEVQWKQGAFGGGQEEAQIIYNIDLVSTNLQDTIGLLGEGLQNQSKYTYKNSFIVLEVLDKLLTGIILVLFTYASIFARQELRRWLMRYIDNTDGQKGQGLYSVA